MEFNPDDYLSQKTQGQYSNLNLQDLTLTNI